MERTLEQMCLKEKIGQMFVVGFHDTELTAEYKELVKQDKVGNVILFSHNIEHKRQLGKLTAELQRCFLEHTGIPGFVTIDQEGGRVTRLPRDATHVPGAMAIASSGRPENAYAAGRITARELMALGINFNLAPVMDVNSNALNPVINVRSYGEDVDTVATYGVQMMRGLMDEGVMSCLKHFPGHGDTEVDSHLGLPIIGKSLEELERLELLPFQAGIARGAEAIMIAHILFPQIEPAGVPGTMSRQIVTGLLKERLGFTGLVLSDCLEMEAIKHYYGTAQGALGAIQAGVELVFVSHTPATAREAMRLIEEAVATGELDEAVIDAAVAKILKYKAKYAGIQKPDEEVVGSEQHRRANELMRLETISLVRGEIQPVAVGSKHALFVGPAAYRTDLASSAVDGSYGFAPYMGQYFQTKYETIAIDLDEQQVSAVLRRAVGCQQVIMGLFNAREHPGQLNLARQLLKTGCHVTVIALGQPYDLGIIEGDLCALAAFDYSPETFRALAVMLSGQATPMARIKIRL
ncbi:beta-N-acetylhexosaminidase [Paenibacillus sanguinis]|uniref:beta-N-acetylhexosaminidase n=1 Tax=Paenibacillus sanguinis TaxID=225906 RepID=UPI00036A1D30|nr:beta-N-acetylhexosaminidase [Paenibacillus sanguinis]